MVLLVLDFFLLNILLCLRAHFRETVSPGRTPDPLSDFCVFPDCDRTLESNPKGPSANWAENAEAV